MTAPVPKVSDIVSFRGGARAQQPLGGQRHHRVAGAGAEREGDADGRHLRPAAAGQRQAGDAGRRQRRGGEPVARRPLAVDEPAGRAGERGGGAERDHGADRDPGVGDRREERDLVGRDGEASDGHGPGRRAAPAALAAASGPEGHGGQQDRADDDASRADGGRRGRWTKRLGRTRGPEAERGEEDLRACHGAGLFHNPRGRAN
jgi:hypothetical protein